MKTIKNQKEMSPREMVSLKTRDLAKRTPLEVWADWLAKSFGTIAFFLLNAIFFGVWIFFNLGFVRGIAPFDPFPFSFLTMLVSLEAIFLSIIVLISQNRASRRDQLRQEIDLEINTISEQEITKIMQMLSKIMEHSHMSTSHDAVLKQMLKPTDMDKIEEDLNKQL